MLARTPMESGAAAESQMFTVAQTPGLAPAAAAGGRAARSSAAAVTRATPASFAYATAG
jgi:hypothetical protein